MPLTHPLNARSYETGDHIAIYPPNSAALVDAFGELFNIDLDTVFALKAIEGAIKGYLRSA